MDGYPVPDVFPKTMSDVTFPFSLTYYLNSPSSGVQILTTTILIGNQTFPEKNENNNKKTKSF